MTFESLGGWDALVRLAGVSHFSQPLSVFIAPKLLNLDEDVAKLSPLGKRIFDVLLKLFSLTIVGTGIIVLLSPHELTTGTPLGSSFVFFLAVMFFYRLYVQLVVYRPYWPMKGYGLFSHYGLSAIFLFNGLAYSAAFSLRFFR